MGAMAQWGLILGAVLPLLIAVLQRPTFPAHLRAAITVAVCIVATVVQLAVEGKLGAGARAVVTQVIVVLGAALVFYQGLWKQLRVAPAIEAATTPKPAAKPDPPRRR